jgi:hypothetical protein
MICHDLPRMLADLRDAAIENLREQIKLKGEPTGVTIKDGIKLKWDFEVDGHLISHITDKHLVTYGGYIYDFSAIDIEKLVTIVELLS